MVCKQKEQCWLWRTFRQKETCNSQHGNQYRSGRKALKTAWQAYSFQGLVESRAQCQAPQIAWQTHSLQSLVEWTSNCQALKTAGQSHSVQGLVEWNSKCQALKTARKMLQIHSGVVNFHPRHSFQCELSLRNWESADIAPGCTQISRNKCAGERCIHTYNTLVLQRLAEQQWCILVMQSDFTSLLWRKSLQNHLLQFMT